MPNAPIRLLQPSASCPSANAFFQCTATIIFHTNPSSGTPERVSSYEYDSLGRLAAVSEDSINRLDPFSGNMQDPQSLHKYLYVHGDPIQGVDPTGYFTIQGTLTSMMISAAITSFAEPIVKPAARYIARGLLPQTVWFNSVTFSAIVVGAQASGGGSYYGIAGGFAGGSELLISPTTG